jgi:DNA-directed RNA polymerase subunit RPC12/RpoP
MSLEFDISCPDCNHKFKERAGNMKPGNTRACPNCGKLIEYAGDDLSKVDLSDLKKVFKDFDK